MNIHHEHITRGYTVAKMTRHHSGRLHWHQRMEFVYILDGECRIKIGKEERLCLPGDIAVMHSGEIHALSNSVP